MIKIQQKSFPKAAKKKNPPCTEKKHAAGSQKNGPASSFAAEKTSINSPRLQKKKKAHYNKSRRKAFLLVKRGHAALFH